MVSLDDARFVRRMTPDDLARQYAAGINAAYGKMVKRVGKAEADKWRANATASAPMYAHQYAAMRDVSA